MECMSELWGGKNRDAFLGGEEFSDRVKRVGITDLES